MSSEEKKPAHPSPVTVEDEDDLDDLDDVLTAFSAGHPPAETQPPPSHAPASATAPGAAPTESEDDFEAELAQGMEKLMRELAAVQAGGGEDGGKEEEEDLLKAWEKVMNTEKERTESGAGSRRAGAGSGTRTHGAPGAGNFQDSIQAAMDRLRDSSEGVSAGLNNESNDPLAALLASLGAAGGAGADAAGGPEGLNGMLEEMMEQLMSKEVLYEPLRELNEKYPSYLAEHAPPKIAQAEHERYTNQAGIVKEIVAKFEDPRYAADGPMAKEVVELMNKMQECGSPPKEIMADLGGGGLELGEDGMPKLPSDMEDCVVM